MSNVYLPAKSFEQNVVTFGSELNASQQSHWRVTSQIVIEVHRIQILDGNPSENCASLFNVRRASAHQLPNQIGERFLIFLGHLKSEEERPV